MPQKLTDLQLEDLKDMPVWTAPVYRFILKLTETSGGLTPELAEARKKLEEAEFWVQQHIVRHGSGKSKKNEA